MAAQNIKSVKQLAETTNLSSIPSNYAYYTNPINETKASEPGDTIPIIDLTLLKSENRAKAIHDLDTACQEWGFFMVANHGIPEELMRSIIEVSTEFFNLAEEEKPEHQPANVLSGIRYGTSFNTAANHIFCWRDYLKLFVHPHFNSPPRPQSLRGVVMEYSERVRGVVSILVKGVSESLGIEEIEMEKALELSSSLQLFAANYYPRCPNPDMTLGLPPHSDHGLFTVLIQNEVGGLQIQHKGTWFNVNPPPNSILVNTGDHLEIFSNGRYKSVLHRAVVNEEKMRISIAMANGPSPETVVRPARQLLQSGSASAYVPMKYKDYLFRQQSNPINFKTLDFQT